MVDNDFLNSSCLLDLGLKLFLFMRVGEENALYMLRCMVRGGHNLGGLL